MDSDEFQTPPEDTFKILIATDNHLGYAEKSSIRGLDSFNTFEEILKLAKVHEVDFILLGGDLFHESKPSPFSLYKCSELLRKYCFGDKSVEIEFLSDPSLHFSGLSIPRVNYEDPNLNISLPVFSIHGNHDDPTGTRHISALDTLTSNGLINYFGRASSYTNIDVKPILLQKGCSKLALFGLSHVKDERLGRLFLDNKVVMKEPEGEDWFNILVLHQNRVARSVKNFIPESSLPDFMDLVIWGHEHDCRIMPEQIANGIHISQPGSSVATSLAIGESLEKHVGLLYVYKTDFKMVPIKLTTVRPFLIDELVLEQSSSSNYCVENPSKQALNQTTEKINEMLESFQNEYKDTNKSLLPLVRLKVFYSNEQQMFNVIRIGMQFNKRVANVEDIVTLHSVVARKRYDECDFDKKILEYDENIEDWATSVEDVIMKYFQNANLKHNMSILSVKALTDAVNRATVHSDDEAFKLVVDKELKMACDKLVEMDLDIEKVDETIEMLRNERLGVPEAAQTICTDKDVIDVDNDPIVLSDYEMALSKKTTRKGEAKRKSTRGSTTRAKRGKITS